MCRVAFFACSLYLDVREADEQVVLCPCGGSYHVTCEMQSKVPHRWIFDLFVRNEICLKTLKNVIVGNVKIYKVFKKNEPFTIVGRTLQNNLS